MCILNGTHRAFGGTVVVRSLTEFNETISERITTLGWYFRGEHTEYDIPFLPSIWRPGHRYQDRTPISANTSFTRGELNALIACHSDVNSGQIPDVRFLDNFEDPSQPIALDSVDIYNWLAFAQHYNQDQRYPTRLVDVSTDSLVALYFAVERNPESSGFVFGLHGNFNNIETVGQVSDQGDTFLDIIRIEGNDGLPYDPVEGTICLLSPPFPNERLQVQSGALIWTRQIGEGYSTGALPFEIPSEFKTGVLDELQSQGYDEASMFPV